MQFCNTKLCLTCSILLLYFLIFAGLPFYMKGPEVRFYLCNANNTSDKSFVYRTHLSDFKFGSLDESNIENEGFGYINMKCIHAHNFLDYHSFIELMQYGEFVSSLRSSLYSISNILRYSQSYTMRNNILSYIDNYTSKRFIHELNNFPYIVIFYPTVEQYGLNKTKETIMYNLYQQIKSGREFTYDEMNQNWKLFYDYIHYTDCDKMINGGFYNHTTIMSC